MASSTTKKVIVARFDREPLSGFVAPANFLLESGMELLSPSGNVTLIPYSEIKAVCFVREFQSGDPMERRAFQVRPKINGLWIRLLFKDGDALEGVLPNSLLLVEAHGLSLIPPDLAGNNQKVFVPRAALKDAQVLGVIGSPLRKDRKDKAPAKEQISLFE